MLARRPAEMEMRGCGVRRSGLLIYGLPFHVSSG
ncbi:MAG: hypothetical protein CM1200mP36_07990 [Gammaproteobacteria bacterium]|nr:MAG: hypothetical protein CM1200mP36_07990 [Gammaproteobacteria bacterium]